MEIFVKGARDQVETLAEVKDPCDYCGGTRKYNGVSCPFCLGTGTK